MERVGAAAEWWGLREAWGLLLNHSLICVCCKQIKYLWPRKSWSNMKQGGAPKGKRPSTELKERDKREHADPALKEKRLLDESGKRRCFFQPKAAQKMSDTGKSVPMPSDTPVHEYTTTPGTDTVLTPSQPASLMPIAHVGNIQSLPKIKDRESGTLYSYHQGGRDIFVRWQVKGKFLACSCDLSESTSCTGNLRLDRCHSLLQSGQGETVIGGRPKEQHDYAAMTGSSAGARRMGGRASLHHGEMDRLAQVCEISRSSNHVSSLYVLDKGRWGKELLEFEAWTFQSAGVDFPLRIGTRWRKTFRGAHATCVHKTSVSIVFDIIMSSFPERPVFQAQDFEGGLFAPVFRATSPGDLERKWLAQNQDIVQARAILGGQRIDGPQFLGFSNDNFAKFFLDQTPEFAQMRLGRQEASQRALHEEVGERQKRRRVHNMLLKLDDLLAMGSSDKEEALKFLVGSREFKSEFGVLLEHEFGDKCADGIVHAYKACVGRGDSAQARLLLSTFSSQHTVVVTMNRFGCSANQVKAANITFRLRNVPEDTRSVIKYSTYAPDTVKHFEGWALNPKQVMRAAYGTAAFLLRANRNRLFLMYRDECQALGIRPMGRTNFYEFYGESIFKPMTRVSFF